MKILLLGSTGFVGHNLALILKPCFNVIQASRKPSDSSFIYFDLSDRNSWNSMLEINPDVIINTAAYGVIKEEKDFEEMYAINYFLISEFCTYMKSNGSRFFWLQLGTAFEFEINVEGGITEQSPCLPRTHYGISKLLMSRFLIERLSAGSFSILRPFGMFGRYEDESKFFPMLIKAQQKKQAVRLSPGTQCRDYFFVEDLGHWIKFLIENGSLAQLPSVVNLGAGKAISLRSYATILEKAIPDFDPSLWRWNELTTRDNESGLFYNSSILAAGLGFGVTELSDALFKTAQHYLVMK